MTLFIRGAAIVVIALAALASDARPSVAHAAMTAATPAVVAGALTPDVDAREPEVRIEAAQLAVWPVNGATITSPYGARPGGFHNGLDLAVPMYTPVRAAQAGIVQVVGQSYMSYGDTAENVIIAHAGKLSTLYGHLDVATHPPIVRPGQSVQAGQVIGYVGMTGWTTGPHVHFTTIYDGRVVNPLDFLP